MSKQEFSDRAMRCAPRLWRIAYLILRNGADCDDAVQEALIRAWTHIGSLRDPALFETWLVRILINAARSQLRRRPDAARLAEIAPAEEPPPDGALHEAIRDLELKYRVPLILHHLEGYPLEECAAMLKLPVSTVKWRLHQARKQLKDALEVSE